MKCIGFILIFFIFSLAVPLSAFAIEDAVTAAEDMYSALDENGESAARSAENGVGFDLNRGIGGVIDLAAENFVPILSASINTAVKLLLTILLFSLIGSLFNSDDSTSTGINLAATAAVTAVGAVEVSSALQVVIDYQNRLTDFSKLILPALAATGAAGGTGGESLMLQSGTAIFTDLTVTAYTKLLIPFVFGYMAIRLGGTIVKNGFFRKLADWLKGLVTGAMRIYLTLFMAYLTISGIAGRAADSLALSSAKTAASSVPYIGGIASEATDAIIAGASVIRGYLGVFGVVGILGSAIVPVMSCGLGWGVTKLSAMFAGAMPSNCGTEAIETIAEAMGLVFAMCAASTALMLLSVVVCAKTVSMA